VSPPLSEFSFETRFGFRFRERALPRLPFFASTRNRAYLYERPTNRCRARQFVGLNDRGAYLALESA